ncbi:FtsK/SpoIIIE domain-containing protein [Streptomyces sp. NPDC006207]
MTETAVPPLPDPESRPALSLVKDETEPVREERVPRPRPAWMQSGTALKQHADYHRANALDWAIHHVTHAPYYMGWSVRGYRNLGRRWIAAHREDYPQLIASARAAIKEANGNPGKEMKAKALKDHHRAEYKLHKRKHLKKTAIWAGIGVPVVTAGAVAGTVFMGGLWVQILLAVAFTAVGAWHGRPETPAKPEVKAPRRPSQLGEDTMRRVLVEAGVVPEKRAEEIRGVGIPHSDGPGTATIVDLPSGIPASAALAKKQQVASAIGVHVDWMDLDIDRSPGSSESRLKVWVSSEDPFNVVRRSPILDHKGKIDTWRDGVTPSFGKRGNPIDLYIRDTSLLAGGATRRGKGMLLANILIGVAKDPWVNVRVFDGKGTAEHNPFAPLLATFVKRNAERLAMFLRAVVQEMDRRSDLLDEYGWEKIDDDNYEEAMRLLGGRELIVVDELATYTPKGTSPWADEITENLSQIAAVGAALGIILISLTQVPEVDVVRGRLRQNHVGRAAMNTESAQASNTILGDGMAGQGYDASRIPINQPGRHFLATPETGVIEARSYLVKPDEKRQVAEEAYRIREAAGRLPGQFLDPIESLLASWTGVSSAAGGERGNGRILPGDVLERLEGLAKATGRGNVTNAEVCEGFAAIDPRRYGRKDGEIDTAWATRVGKAIKAEIVAKGAVLEPKRLPEVDGTRPNGYTLSDITDARNALK